MAYNKVIYNNNTLIDLTTDTVTADKLMQGYTAHDKSGTLITGTAHEGGDVPVWQGTDDYVYVSDTADAPVEIYTDDGYVVLDMAPAQLNLQTKSVTPTESAQVVTADSGYDGLEEVDVGAISSSYVGSGIARKSSSDLTVSGATVTAPSGYYESSASKTVASGTEGTPTATKGTVSNNSVSVTPSVTNTAGYITGSTKTGTAVSVSASELVSGTLSINSSGTKDVTNYASASVASGSATPASTISGTSATVSTGMNTLTLSKSVSNTPQVSAGYVSSGTAGNSSVSLTANVTTKAAATYTPSTSTQTISANQYLTGAQTINPIPSQYIVPSGTKSITENGTGIDVASYASVDVNVPSSGGSSYTLIASTSYQVSTTSTTAVSVGTFETGDTSIWTSDKMVFVKIRDLAGRRNGYFYGSDSIICNNVPGNNLTSTSSYLIYGTMYYQNTAGYLINMNLQRTRSSYQMEGYGVYPRLIHDDGSIDIYATYSTGSYITTQTIDGTFNVEVYLLEWPDNINPFIG